MALDAQGSDFDAQGLALDAQGSDFDAQGLALDAQGSDFDAQGLFLDAQGLDLAAQGSDLDAQGSAWATVLLEELVVLAEQGLVQPTATPRLNTEIAARVQKYFTFMECSSGMLLWGGDQNGSGWAIAYFFASAESRTLV
ncbi:MAG: hypothetical protein MH252_19995 [Thermosynechococcaceae cyanobacterium MS004]|nr:hypothetical protein [Thermosynechococcaceae cyanobacterium MS004]